MNTVRKVSALMVCTLMMLVAASGVAAAQSDGEIRGTLTIEDSEGERVGVEGIRIVVRDTDGAEVGEGTSGPDGVFSVIVPSPADYVASIDQDSIPEGITLRNPDRAELEISLNDGQQRNVLFPLDSDEVVATADDSGSSGNRLGSLIVDGLIFGLIIAMCAIGLSLIFGTTGLVNFAHGELVSIGAVSTLAFNTGGLHVIPAALLGIVCAGVFGGINEVGLWRPLRRRGTGLIAMLVISIGLSILLRYLMLYFIGGRRESYNQYALQLDSYDFFGVPIVNRQIWIIGISLTMLILVAIGVQRTKTGKAMRAVADNVDLAESSGINVERVVMTIWIIGAALAGLGGVLFGLNQGVSWNMGFELLLLMFAAVTLGGLGTAYGPLFGSIIVGLFINLSTYPSWVTAEIKNVGALLILGVILLVRPQGLLGRAERVG